MTSSSSNHDRERDVDVFIEAYWDDYLRDVREYSARLGPNFRPAGHPRDVEVGMLWARKCRPHNQRVRLNAAAARYMRGYTR